MKTQNSSFIRGLRSPQRETHGCADPPRSQPEKHRTRKEWTYEEPQCHCMNADWLTLLALSHSLPLESHDSGAQLSENSLQGIRKQEGNKPGGLYPQAWLKNLGSEENTERRWQKVAYLLGQRLELGSEEVVMLLSSLFSLKIWE